LPGSKGALTRSSLATHPKSPERTGRKVLTIVEEKEFAHHTSLEAKPKIPSQGYALRRKTGVLPNSLTGKMRHRRTSGKGKKIQERYITIKY